MSHNECQFRMKQALGRDAGRNFLLSESEICAGGEEGKDACDGDGGAPLVCQSKDNRWNVVGLSSLNIVVGMSSLECHHWNVIIGVSSYHHWNVFVIGISLSSSEFHCRHRNFIVIECRRNVVMSSSCRCHVIVM